MIQYLLLNGDKAVGFSSLAELGSAVDNSVPDVLVADLSFPDKETLFRIRDIKSHYIFPIIITSDDSSESSLILSFSSGCDDYLVKPYSLKELTLRLSTLARRFRAADAVSVWQCGKSRMAVNSAAHDVSIDGVRVSLSVSEWKILTLFLRSADRFVSRQTLSEVCQSDGRTKNDRSVDTHIKNVRRKLSVSKQIWIETVRGCGYRFLGNAVRQTG